MADAEDAEQAVQQMIPIIPSGQHSGKTVDAVWAEDPQSPKASQAVARGCGERVQP